MRLVRYFLSSLGRLRLRETKIGLHRGGDRLAISHLDAKKLSGGTKVVKFKVLGELRDDLIEGSKGVLCKGHVVYKDRLKHSSHLLVPATAPLLGAMYLSRRHTSLLRSLLVKPSGCPM